MRRGSSRGFGPGLAGRLLVVARVSSRLLGGAGGSVSPCPGWLFSNLLSPSACLVPYSEGLQKPPKIHHFGVWKGKKKALIYLFMFSAVLLLWG